MAKKEVLEMEIKSNTKGVTKDVDKLGTSTEKAKGGFKGIGTAIKGMGTALKAAGIGLVVAGFMALKEALERNQKVMNTVNSVMTTVSTTFNQVVDVLVETFNWVTKSGDRFDGLTKVISGLLTIALTPLKLSFYAIKLGVEQAMLAWEKSFLGSGDTTKIKELTANIEETKDSIEQVALQAVDAGKNVVTNFMDAVGEIGSIGERVIAGVSEISVKANYEQAKATTAAKNSAALAEVALQGLIEKNDLLAETQRQIRDDETKTFAQRIAANEELGRVLDKQEEDMLKLADQRIAAAALELAQNKQNVELQAAYQQALNDRAGVEAQIAGFRSEQLVNEVSLNKELAEIQDELLLSTLEGIDLELAELQTAYDAKVEMARKAGMDTTALTKKYEDDKAKIIMDNNKAIKKAAQMTSQANLQIASTTAGNMAKILGEETKAGKAMAITQATIDTYKGATAAYAAMAGIPVVGPALGAIAAGAAIAAGIANVKAITSTGEGGGGGGGGISAPSGGGGGGGSASPAPQMMSGAFELEGGAAPEPVKAFVVTDEMSNSQDQLANIRRKATI